MSGKNWRYKFEKKHGHVYGSIDMPKTDGKYLTVRPDEVIDFENNSDLKEIMGLAIEFPEGRKTVIFPSNCSLLEKVLDGEFILKQNSDNTLMVLWQKGLLFLRTTTGIVNGRYEIGEPIKYSSEIVANIKRLTDESQDIEKRLRTIGISFLHRADTIGFPDYNSVNMESGSKVYR